MFKKIFKNEHFSKSQENIQEIKEDELPDVILKKLSDYRSASDHGMLGIDKIEKIVGDDESLIKFKIYGSLDKHDAGHYLGSQEVVFTAEVSDSSLISFDREDKKWLPK